MVVQDHADPCLRAGRMMQESRWLDPTCAERLDDSLTPGIVDGQLETRGETGLGRRRGASEWLTRWNTCVLV